LKDERLETIADRSISAEEWDEIRSKVERE
jgi:hypothetical protein